MPPVGRPRPDPATLSSFVKWLEDSLDRAALEQPFSAGILAERDLFCALFDTEDMAIGVKAFLNREKAEWTGA